MYRYENVNGDREAIVISGFERGIADAPELGLSDMRSVNITSIPGESPVGFSTTAGSTPTSASGAAFTATSSNNQFAVSSTSGYFPGMAIRIASTTATAQVNVLVVGGGAGGAGNPAGGGGGGQVTYQTNVAVKIGTYNCNVGAGGAGGSGNPGSSTGGVASTFSGNGASTITGSGGGAAGTNNIGGASGSGNAGGAGNTVTNTAGGGGGGDGAAGGNASPAQGGTGGNGTANSITGSSVTYGGGGGGGVSGGAGTHGNGGTGGGGNGGDTNGGATNGTNGLGGGGGGGGGNLPATGGNGGNGAIIISFPTGLLTVSTVGGVKTQSGGNDIWSFNSQGAGTFTISAVNPQVGDVYYIGNVTSTTFKIYYDVAITNNVAFIENHTGTYNVQAIGTPVWTSVYGINSAVSSAKDNALFMVDNTGNAWLIPTVSTTYPAGTITAGSLQWLGNAGHSVTGTSADFGICAFNGYLFVIIKQSVDYISIANLYASAIISNNWVYAWKSNLSQTSYQHQAIVGTDGIMYICNASAVASLIPNGTLDPTNSGTYTWSASALTIPATDSAQCLANLGGQTPLLIGGVGNNVYVWDRISLTPGFVLICAESNIQRIVSTNSNAYVFAGNRGRIYITNGTQMQLYKKVPDHISGAPEPYYTWQDALYFRNKLYFTLTATDNAGNTLSTMGGIWCLGIDAGQTVIQLPTAGSLFGAHQLSYGTYGGSIPCLFLIPFSAFQNINPLGYGVGAFWSNSGTLGIDIPSSNPYSNYQTYIDTDLIPVGTALDGTTFRMFEYKLAKPLVTNEKLKLAYRTDLSASFTQVVEWTNTGQVSDVAGVNFEKAQWVQFRISLSSISSTPSYVRLKELWVWKK